MLCIRGTSHWPVSVRPSVTSRCSIETTERIELVDFGMGASFRLSYAVLKGNSSISKHNGTSLIWNFVVNSRENFAKIGISIVETCYRLSSRKRDKLGRRQSTKLTIPPSSDARHQFITVIIKLHLQHDSVARVY